MLDGLGNYWADFDRRVARSRERVHSWPRHKGGTYEVLFALPKPLEEPPCEWNHLFAAGTLGWSFAPLFPTFSQTFGLW